jgi:hypothetical protein
VCSHTPSEDYAHHALRSEKKLSSLANFLGKKKKKRNKFASTVQTEEEEQLQVPIDTNAEVARVLHSSYHPYHALFDSSLKMFARHFSQTSKWKQLIRVSNDLVRAHESRPVVIGDKAADMYALAGGYLAQCGAIPEHSAQLPVALEYLRKALRVHLTLHGRRILPEKAHLEKMIQSLLSILPVESVNPAVCSFCSESPDTAYMSNKECDEPLVSAGEEKDIFFCCIGCQEAFKGIASRSSIDKTNE